MSNQNGSGEITRGVAGLTKKKISIAGVIFIMYCSCAAGAFGIEDMVPVSGPGMTIILLLFFAIFWALPICLGIAEMMSVLPEEGGAYVWTRETLGEFWGFQSSWWGALSYYVGLAAYVALAVGYIEFVFPMGDTQAYLLKVAIVIIFTVINLIGIKEVSFLSTLFSILVILAFATVTVVGFLNWNQNPMEPVVAEGVPLSASIASGLGICVWMYCGFVAIPTLAGEFEDPVILRKGFLWCVPIIALTYLFPITAGLASVGEYESWSTEGDVGSGVGYSTVLTEYIGPAAGVAFLVVAIISAISIYNASVAAGSRIFFVLSDDNLFPKSMNKLSKRNVPHISILSMAVVALLFIQFDFSTIILIEVIFVLACYMLLAIVLFKMRKVIPLEKRRKDSWKIPGGKFGLWFCMLSPVIVGGVTLMLNGTDYFLMGIVGLCSGVVAYVIFRKIYGGLTKKDPVAYPMNPKTKLAFGDTKIIGIFLVLAGLLSVLGSVVLYIYEGSWADEYYPYMYEGGLFANFGLMIELLRYVGIGIVAVGVILIILSKKIERRE